MGRNGAGGMVRKTDGDRAGGQPAARRRRRRLATRRRGGGGVRWQGNGSTSEMGCAVLGVI